MGAARREPARCFEVALTRCGSSVGLLGPKRLVVAAEQRLRVSSKSLADRTFNASQ